MTHPPRVMILDGDPDPLRGRLLQQMPDLDVACCDSYADLPAALARHRPEVLYSVTFAGRAGYPAEAVLGCDGPAWIAVGGSGVDHLGTWDARAVTVTNTAGSAAFAMAEHVFATVLHFTCDIAGLEEDRRARRWNSARMMVPLRGKTMLIVGLGQTGQAVALRAKAFGMRVIGTRARPCEMVHVDRVHAGADLPALWPEADVIVLSVPLIDATRGLVGDAAFAAMKPSAILIDVSRGGVIAQDALIAAIRRGAIACAALDVFDEEPLPEDSPIWDLPNVIVSPHSSSVYADWTMQSFEAFIDNLRNWRAGRVLSNIVDPARGY